MLELGIGQGPRGPAGAVPEKGVMPNQQDAPLARILLSKNRASMPAKQEACQRGRQARTVPTQQARILLRQAPCHSGWHASC